MPDRIKQIVIDGKHYGHKFFCPGCQRIHSIATLPNPSGWEWNGKLDLPTFNPSIRFDAYEVNRGGVMVMLPCCHSVISHGKITFEKDSEHELTGQTVELGEFPK